MAREEFRNRLATADKHGRRRWLFPRKPEGKWYKRRTWFSWLLLALMFVGPFVKINGHPLLMLNIVERRFSILGQIFWPQDSAIFAVAMLIFIVGIVVFTTAFGRLWCGWACPQTVLMELVFRKIEYWLDGDSSAQKALHKAPWTRGKIGKRALKHTVFFGLSFLIGNWLLSYIIGLEDLLHIVVDDPRKHITGLTFMMGFTAIFYLIFARFREQACTFICPYGRFQSAMLDENTMVVAYDHRRGEGRARLQRAQTHENRRAEGMGDCVDCRACVTVCPTGIDIRNGLQMECVNCTACIDACDKVMGRLGWDKGLIRYASLNSIERKEKFRFTPRMGVYAALLTGLIGFFLLLIFTRTEVETTFLRAPGALFQEAGEGRISNLYTVKVVNKSRAPKPLTFALEGLPGEVKIMGGQFVVPQENIAQTSVLIMLDRDSLAGRKTDLRVAVYSGGKRLDSIKTSFIGPRD